MGERERGSLIDYILRKTITKQLAVNAKRDDDTKQTRFWREKPQKEGASFFDKRRFMRSVQPSIRRDEGTQQ